MTEIETAARRKLLTSVYALDDALKKFPRLRYAINYHRNLRKEPMDFHDKPYLVEIYKDDAQHICLQSSVQTGKSEFLIVSALEAAERGLQVLYVLPTIEIRNNFVANRVDTLMRTIPHYQSQIYSGKGASDARGLKHYGAGALFFAGSNSSTTFIEKPVDITLADEVDRFNLANYAMADDRMTASPYKLKYEASNPTVENYGINRSYRYSDQRVWMIKCDSCGSWEQIDWFKNVIRPIDEFNYELRDTEWTDGCGRDANAFCTRCDSPLNRFSTRAAWVAKNPSVKSSHGYHIHQLLSSFVKISEMWRKFQKATESETEMQVFFNSMLGVPFAGKGSKITREHMEKTKAAYLMPHTSQKQCVMGIDVGKRLNVVIREIVQEGVLRLVYANRVRDFEDLDELFSRYNIVGYVIDSMPETRKAIEWAKRKPGRGYICRYNSSLSEVKVDDDNRIVSADRTMIMDKVFRAFMTNQRPIPANADQLDHGSYYEDMTTPTRVYDAQRNTYDWVGDPDHYFHAEVYATLAYVCRGDFGVIGVPVNQPVFASGAAGGFDEKAFPPGTPKSIIEHYRAEFERSRNRLK